MRMPVIPCIIALTLAATVASVPVTAQRSAKVDRAAEEQRKLTAALVGLVPGRSSTCLPETARTQMQTQGYGRTILYKVNRSLTYRTETSGGCERIARGDVLVTRQYGGRLCSGDIATTFDPVARFQTGSCSFGPFTAYKRP